MITISLEPKINLRSSFQSITPWCNRLKWFRTTKKLWFLSQDIIFHQNKIIPFNPKYTTTDLCFNKAYITLQSIQNKKKVSSPYLYKPRSNLWEEGEKRRGLWVQHESFPTITQSPHNISPPKTHQQTKTTLKPKKWALSWTPQRCSTKENFKWKGERILTIVHNHNQQKG